MKLKEVTAGLLAGIISIVLILLGTALVILFTVLNWLLVPLAAMVGIGALVYCIIMDCFDKS